MIQWAIIATLVGAGSLYGFIRTLQAKHKQASEYETRLDNLKTALDRQRAETERRAHIIKAQEEAISHAAKEKRQIREQADPGDRARAATDKLRELAGNGDGS